MVASYLSLSCITKKVFSSILFYLAILTAYTWSISEILAQTRQEFCLNTNIIHEADALEHNKHLIQWDASDNTNLKEVTLNRPALYYTHARLNSFSFETILNALGYNGINIALSSSTLKIDNRVYDDSSNIIQSQVKTASNKTLHDIIVQSEVFDAFVNNLAKDTTLFSLIRSSVLLGTVRNGNSPNVIPDPAIIYNANSIFSGQYETALSI